MKRKAIICDLDGTLCDEKHRRLYINGEWGKKEYDLFYEAMDKDDVHAWCREMVLMYLRFRYDIIFITGRPEKYRHKTTRWLHEKVGLVELSHYRLFMRPDNNYECDTIIKKQIYHEHIMPHCDVQLILEDRDRVVRMWRELGLTCLQVAEGNF
jgi:FMN phosphatase YigB (HAD superfamily)